MCLEEHIGWEGPAGAPADAQQSLLIPLLCLSFTEGGFSSLAFKVSPAEGTLLCDSCS